MSDPPKEDLPPRPPARPTIHSPQPLPTPPPKEPPTFWSALTTLHWSDLQKVHLIPCAREAFMVGIAAGFAFGGVKLVLKSSIPTAANWAVGTFCGTSIVVYEACGLRKYKERAGMQRAVEIMERQAREKRGRGGKVGWAADGEKSLESEESIPKEEGGKERGKVYVVETVVVEEKVDEKEEEKKERGGKSWYKFW